MSSSQGFDVKVKLIGATKPNYVIDLDEAMKFSGYAAGVCYMPDSLDALFGEPAEKTLKRAEMTLKHGHHSVFDHTVVNLSLEGIPKILAMILNNEKVFSTSEKSARYTIMQPTAREQYLYDKWLEIYKLLIAEKYPAMDKNSVQKLAQENARYLISIFTPTTMIYSTNLRQLNYLHNWFMDFVNAKHENELFNKLKPSMSDFVKQTEFLHIEGLADGKGRGLSLFDYRTDRAEEFGENYCAIYYGSYAQLAQAQRHRTLDYKISVKNINPFFYTPEILGHIRSAEWLDDIYSLDDLFPQGKMVKIIERGTYENLILKAQERLCSHAQLEISNQTRATIIKYLYEVERINPEVYEALKAYNYDARCEFDDYHCSTPCHWGAEQLERLV